MKDDLRFVFDTNVLISAILFKTSVPRQALDLARRIGKIIMSWPTMAELHDVLGRKRFDKYIAEDERMMFLEALALEILPIEIIETVTDCRDKKDNKFLEVAVNGDDSRHASSLPVNSADQNYAVGNVRRFPGAGGGDPVCHSLLDHMFAARGC